MNLKAFFNLFDDLRIRKMFNLGFPLAVLPRNSKEINASFFVNNFVPFYILEIAYLKTSGLIY